MSRYKVFLTREIDPEIMAFLSKEVVLSTWDQVYPPPREVLLNNISTFDGIITTVMDAVDAPLLRLATNLKVVSQLAVGVDNIDLVTATARGLPVGHTPGVLSKATADLTMALILSISRQIVETTQWVRNGSWEVAFHPKHWLGIEMTGSTLGIVGFGKIGKEVATRALGFTMNVICSSRTLQAEEQVADVKKVDFKTLLSTSDFITLHVPYTPLTHHMISYDQLKMMKPTAVLINTSRGPVIDTDALYWALKNGIIRGAGLDVIDPEPIPPNHPILELENVLITPHIGSATVTTRREMALLAARNVMAGLKGDILPCCANPEVYCIG